MSLAYGTVHVCRLFKIYFIYVFLFYSCYDNCNWSDMESSCFKEIEDDESLQNNTAKKAWTLETPQQRVTWNSKEHNNENFDVCCMKRLPHRGQPVNLENVFSKRNKQREMFSVSEYSVIMYLSSVITVEDRKWRWTGKLQTSCLWNVQLYKQFL